MECNVALFWERRMELMDCNVVLFIVVGNLIDVM